MCVFVCGNGQALTSAQVIAAQEAVAAAAGGIVVFGPTVDGVELPDLPWNLAAKGAFANHVPLLLVSSVCLSVLLTKGGVLS
jgi:hypothetical protein